MRLTICILVGWIAALGAIAAGKPADTIDPQLLGEIKKVTALSETLGDLQAKFTQEKYSPLLKAPLISRGELLIRGPVMRWNTQHPAPMVTYISAKEVMLYYPDDAQAEVYPIQERYAAFITSPLPRLQMLMNHFSIQRQDGPSDPALLRLVMTPNDPDLKKHLKSIAVDVEVATGVARRIDMTDSQGDRTLFQLSEIRVNTGMSEQEITLKLPAGTRISRPLSGKESPDGR